jgi:hypothetical protein
MAILQGPFAQFPEIRDHWLTVGPHISKTTKRADDDFPENLC